MANPQTGNRNEEDMWVDGAPFVGIKTSLLLDTGDEKYWSDGAPALCLFPKGNNDTGKFFLLFDE
jgi:hypothetical protein